MNKEEKLDYLIDVLISESNEYKITEMPKNIKDKVNLLRSLMNLRMPKKISDEFLEIQNQFLKEQTKEKGIVKLDDIKTIKEEYSNTKLPFANKISLWQGDITRLKVDAIVNAGNSKLLGCFVPCHGCIDNIIHFCAGVQLREECNEIMKKQGHDEKTGKAKITDAYNLPSKKVIHTVGPIVYGNLTKELEEDLSNCYKSCLEIALENNIRSIAFCCISTGEFRFPNKRAAQIAIETVINFINENDYEFDRIIFNVFKDIDRDIYETLLKSL
ncbi:MAG: protein-ADP-ribose hydrolase [Clostridium baratii]|uniref:Macro domain protein n=1 Tax=Clostridium baratii str. Sullivan TaxID=1415775 RepID=A0A0A7FTC0_9CLOT|nr:protein-ADP-ribose hydrolase [Clostridium baratii]AIY82832.1 macro domain protein [Clostridium baratii str. Sullivan]MBS6005877.1 protein-ADP-ribose hydrolase [Clostridium baratii]MDU1052941.1 protein-ADP-ribose hydrolase [Clostridium baratii]CUP20129.1 Predicted phosphatase homologous to the C-terminal domain of histone macroH2A1 [Clostridium baratii]